MYPHLPKSRLGKSAVPSYQTLSNHGCFFWGGTELPRALRLTSHRDNQSIHFFRAVSKWPRCRWDVKHNQPTNQPFLPFLFVHLEAGRSQFKSPNLIKSYGLLWNIKKQTLISHGLVWSDSQHAKPWLGKMCIILWHHFLGYEDPPWRAK